MDPFSITVGCVGLISSIAGVSSQIVKFVRDVRDSRKDMEALSRELASLTICLEILHSDCENSAIQYPASFRDNLVKILSNCDTVTIEMGDLLRKLSNKSLEQKVQWVMSGKDEVNKLRLRLEAHKGAIEIALDMLQILLIREIKEDTTNILDDTNAIRQDTSRLPAIHDDVSQIPKLVEEITKLKLQIETLGQPGSQDNILIQRFLDDTATYTDTECDDLDTDVDNYLSVGLPGDEELGQEDPAQSYDLPRNTNVRDSNNEKGKKPSSSRQAQSASSPFFSSGDVGALDQTVEQENNQTKLSTNPGPEIASQVALGNNSLIPIPSAISEKFSSLTAWSISRLTYTTSNRGMFPRAWLAVNPIASKDGDIYLMGGRKDGDYCSADLWKMEVGKEDILCYPIETTGVAPNPRVAHASLLVGNKLIIYGGNLHKDSIIMDLILYVLNTLTRKWTRMLHKDVPPARRAHSMNAIGSNIYVFGGWTFGGDSNELFKFDLNHLDMSSNRCELLGQEKRREGKTRCSIPPFRAAHSMVIFDEKLYLFGGWETSGFFNDVWSYEPANDKWSELNCVGKIPRPRFGHAAAVVGDMMYIFGGESDRGWIKDLFCFHITTCTWYELRDIGPSPPVTRGHSMTTYGKRIFVLGGERGPAVDYGDPEIIYILDTTKIQWPIEGQFVAEKQKNESIVKGPSLQNTRTESIEERSTENPGLKGSPPADEQHTYVAKYKGARQSTGNVHVGKAAR